MWIVHNSKHIHEDIQDINTRKRRRDISTFDVSTLYTKIEHYELKEAMEYVIKKTIIGSRMERMSIYSTNDGLSTVRYNTY